MSRQLNYVVCAVVGAAVATIIVLMVVRSDLKKAGDDVSEKMEQVTREGVKEGIKEGVDQGVRSGVRSGVEVAQDQARKLPGEVLGQIADLMRPKTKSESDEVVEGDDRGTKAKERMRPQNLVRDAFEFGRQTMKQADDALQQSFELDAQDETEIGESTNELLRSHFKPLDAPEQVERLEKLAAPILEARQRKGIEYTIAILDDPEINACSIPGGYIYLNQGLLDFVGSDTELQFVLAHEIAHIDLKHCLRNFTYAVRAAELGGTLTGQGVSALYRQYELQFSEELEFEADAYALRRLSKLGVTREDALAFQRRMIDHYKAEGAPTASKKPKSVPEALQNELSNHFRTHPPAEERLQKLEEIPLPGPKEPKRQ